MGNRDRDRYPKMHNQDGHRPSYSYQNERHHRHGPHEIKQFARGNLTWAMKRKFMRRSPSPVRAGSHSVDKKRQKIKSERIFCDNKKELNNHIEFPKDQRENKYSKTWKIKGEKQSGNESRESDSDNSRQSRKLLKSLDSIKKEHKKIRRSTSSSGSSSSSRRSCSSTRRKKIIKKEKRDRDELV